MTTKHGSVGSRPRKAHTPEASVSSSPCKVSESSLAMTADLTAPPEALESRLKQ